MTLPNKITTLWVGILLSLVGLAGYFWMSHAPGNPVAGLVSLAMPIGVFVLMFLVLVHPGDEPTQTQGTGLARILRIMRLLVSLSVAGPVIALAAIAAFPLQAIFAAVGLNEDYVMLCRRAGERFRDRLAGPSGPKVEGHGSKSPSVELAGPEITGSRAKTVGVDYAEVTELGQDFDRVLATSLRNNPEHLVIVTPRPTDRVHRMCQSTVESGHGVTLVARQELAPQVDRWLKAPTN